MCENSRFVAPMGEPREIRAVGQVVAAEEEPSAASAEKHEDLKIGTLDPSKDLVSKNAHNHVEDWNAQFDQAKADADAAFKAGNFNDAIQHYTLALSLDPQSAVVLSNRSAAYLKANAKSKALHDAQACVQIGTMGVKGLSRLAAALQALGRHDAAANEYAKIVQLEPQHAVALKGLADCRQAAADRQREIDEQRKKEEAEAADVEEGDDGDGSAGDKARNGENDGDDDLDDFFNDVEEATTQLQKKKEEAAQPQATNAIKNQKKDLGTAQEQIDRILQPNYTWKNLNPFHVLDLTHTATTEQISRRYKALSLLLHPDKNHGDNAARAQDAYDQVLTAKAVLDDEHRLSHTKALIEEGLKIGADDYRHNKAARSNRDTALSLDDCQRTAVMKLFAEVEQARRTATANERKHKQREQAQQDEALQKERDASKFHKEWTQGERVEARIGNWRDFSDKKRKTG